MIEPAHANMCIFFFPGRTRVHLDWRSVVVNLRFSVLLALLSMHEPTRLLHFFSPDANETWNACVTFFQCRCCRFIYNIYINIQAQSAYTLFGHTLLFKEVSFLERRCVIAFTACRQFPSTAYSASPWQLSRRASTGRIACCVYVIT